MCGAGGNWNEVAVEEIYESPYSMTSISIKFVGQLDEDPGNVY